MFFVLPFWQISTHSANHGKIRQIVTFISSTNVVRGGCKYYPFFLQLGAFCVKVGAFLLIFHRVGAKFSLGGCKFSPNYAAGCILFFLNLFDYSKIKSPCVRLLRTGFGLFPKRLRDNATQRLYF